MIKRTVTRLALGLALATASAAAMADAQTGWYFGLSGGQAQVDIDQDEFDALVEDTFASVGFPLISGSSSLEDSDTSFAAYGGYRFSQYFAVEGSFIDFGTAEYRASGNVNPPGPTVSVPASYLIDGKKWPTALFRTVAPRPPAKDVTFAGCVVAVSRCRTSRPEPAAGAIHS